MSCHISIYHLSLHPNTGGSGVKVHFIVKPEIFHTIGLLLLLGINFLYLRIGMKP